MTSNQSNIFFKLLAVFPIITLTAVLQFCVPSATPSSTTGYHEDLSGYRTQYPKPDYIIAETETTQLPEETNVTPTNHIKAELDSVVNIIIATRKDINYINGFSIQLYSGNNRDKAYAARRQAIGIIEDFKPSMGYEQPNYKVRIGKYYSRLEANKDITIIKSLIPQAVLVPSRIRIE